MKTTDESPEIQLHLARPESSRAGLRAKEVWAQPITSCRVWFTLSHGILNRFITRTSINRTRVTFSFS
jgi:hypothetical protein